MDIRDTFALVTPPDTDFARTAAHHLIVSAQALLNADPHKIVTLTLPTGNTPKPVYDVLTQSLVNHRLRSTGERMWDRVRLLQLDERVGETVYADSMRELASGLLIPETRLLLIDGKAEDPEAEALRHRAVVRDNPPDIMALGIGGHDGHIAFNQPGSARDSLTRIVNLSAGTQGQQSAYGDGATATQGLTMGIAEITACPDIILWSTGAGKSKVLGEALNGPITEDIPASLCRTGTGILTIVSDEPAASCLTEDHDDYKLALAA